MITFDWKLSFAVIVQLSLGGEHGPAIWTGDRSLLGVRLDVIGKLVLAHKLVRTTFNRVNTDPMVPKRSNPDGEEKTTNKGLKGEGN